MEETDTSVVQEIAKLAQAGMIKGDANGVPYVIVPDDHQIIWLDKYLSNRETPIRKEGSVHFTDAASFIRYWSLFSDEGSRIFADQTNTTLTAVLDYHMAGSDSPARWGKHRATFSLVPTTEWVTWSNSNGKRKSQMEFAEFIEDNAADIFSPKAADMVQIARELEAKKDVDFASSVRLNNGKTQFKYSETIKATVGGGQLEVPELFVIRLRVYQGTDPVEITARLRFRIQESKLTLWYDLLRPHTVREQAFESIVNKVSKEANTDVLIGSPAKNGG